MLRFFVESWLEGGCVQNRVKYLTLHQKAGHGVTYQPGFFARELFKKSGPFTLPSGYWNCANVSFVMEEEEDDEKESIFYLWAEISDEKLSPLPELEPEAIWAEKPVLEYVKLSITDISLETIIPVNNSDRIRVVTHDDIDNRKTRMVMKIWPSPMCSKVGLEREMMAYRACDGKDITPKFVGHVAEEGRVIGFLTEYIEGAHMPSSDDEKELCRRALYRFYRLTGWHRNPMASHKANFLIKDGKAYLVDLAMAYTPQDVASLGDEWANEKV